MADNRTMEELLQAATEGYGKAIVIPEINADHFEIKTNLLQLVQANPYHGFERENPHTHINNFKWIASTLKFRDVPNDVIKLMMFPYSLEGSARVWYDKEPPNSVLIWEDLVNKVVNQFFPPSKTTYLKNEISQPNFLKILPKPNIPYPSRLNDQKLRKKARNQMEKFFQIFQDLHFDISFADALLLMPKFASMIKCLHANKDKLFELAKILLNENCSAMLLKKLLEKLGDLGKFLIPCDFLTQQTVLMEQQNAFQNNLQNMLSVFFQNQSTTLGTLPSNTIPNPKGEIKAITTRSGVAYEGPLIPTPKKVVERETEETTDKEQTNFRRSTAHIQPPGEMKENTTWSGVAYDGHSIPTPKKVVERDTEETTDKEQSNFQGSTAHIQPPKKLSLPELTPTRMTLELANRSITRPKGVAEDVFFKVGKFHFLTDFVVVDFEADPRVPLILRRSFLRTDRSLIDVYEEEITLREYAQEMLGFSNNSSGGNTTLTSEPIISDSSPFLTPFEGSDFILEEIEGYLKKSQFHQKLTMSTVIQREIFA
nr:reverse transcriptase domain-containing protein [Tanacetum cinerariifolium]